MSEDPKAESPGVGSQAPAFSADEAQPSSAIDERNALSEREDGVNRGGSEPAGGPGQAPDAIPTIVLTGDEQQPISAVDEHKALSEREDGVNRG